MKYYFLAGGVIAAAVVATFMAHQQTPSEFPMAKRNAVEKENKNRPAHYQDLMYKPEAEVQLRAPASSDKK